MTKQSTAALPKARSTGLVVRELDSETLIYDLVSHKVTCLNAFAAQVWRLCDGNRTVHEITGALTLAEPKEGAVALTLKKLSRADLLTGAIHSAHPVPSAHPAPSALSRRAVVHGALSTAIPIVTTIVAPVAAQAVSCPGTAGPCGPNGECPSPFVCFAGCCVVF